MMPITMLELTKIPLDEAREKTFHLFDYLIEKYGMDESIFSCDRREIKQANIQRIEQIIGLFYFEVWSGLLGRQSAAAKKKTLSNDFYEEIYRFFKTYHENITQLITQYSDTLELFEADESISPTRRSSMKKGFESLEKHYQSHNTQAAISEITSTHADDVAFITMQTLKKMPLQQAQKKALQIINSINNKYNLDPMNMFSDIQKAIIRETDVDIIESLMIFVYLGVWGGALNSKDRTNELRTLLYNDICEMYYEDINPFIITFNERLELFHDEPIFSQYKLLDLQNELENIKTFWHSLQVPQVSTPSAKVIGTPALKASTVIATAPLTAKKFQKMCSPVVKKRATNIYTSAVKKYAINQFDHLDYFQENINQITKDQVLPIMSSMYTGILGIILTDNTNEEKRKESLESFYEEIYLFFQEELENTCLFIMAYDNICEELRKIGKPPLQEEMILVKKEIQNFGKYYQSRKQTQAISSFATAAQALVDEEERVEKARLDKKASFQKRKSVLAALVAQAIAAPTLPVTMQTLREMPLDEAQKETLNFFYFMNEKYNLEQTSYLSESQKDMIGVDINHLGNVIEFFYLKIWSNILFKYRTEQITKDEKKKLLKNYHEDVYIFFGTYYDNIRSLTETYRTEFKNYIGQKPEYFLDKRMSDMWEDIVYLEKELNDIEKYYHDRKGLPPSELTSTPVKTGSTATKATSASAEATPIPAPLSVHSVLSKSKFKTTLVDMNKMTQETKDEYTDDGKKLYDSLLNAEQQFTDTGNLKKFSTQANASVKQSKHKLEKSPIWKQFLLDILNAIIFITTLGISFLITGRFRLFSIAPATTMLNEDLIKPTPMT